MPGRRFNSAVLAAVAFWAMTAHAAQPAALVVRSAAQLETVLSQPTPLDALTPYGKRRFLQSLAWGEQGIVGFSPDVLVRELEPEQIAVVLAFLGASDYLPMLLERVSGPPLRLPAPSADGEARLNQLIRVQADKTVDAGRMARHFETLFGERMSGTKLRTLPLGDLPLYFDAAHRAVFGRPDAAASRDFALVYEEMRRRGIDTRRTFDKAMLGHLLEARRFDAARALVAGKPHLAGTIVPTVRDPLGPAFAGRSAYRYKAATQTLVREALPQAAGIELVMVVDAGCAFSARALAALQEDATLRVRLQKAGLILIIPPRASIAVDFIDEWNRANPAIPMRVPYSVEEWQAVDVADVPRFFVLKEGKVVGQLSGWPEEGNKAALIALLDRAAR